MSDFTNLGYIYVNNHNEKIYHMHALEINLLHTTSEM